MIYGIGNLTEMFLELFLIFLVFPEILQTSKLPLGLYRVEKKQKELQKKIRIIKNINCALPF